MPYSVKEIFYTLQGEGAHSGRAAVFLRFSGCNLWSGREEDRGRGPGGCSKWCDTDFRGTKGPGGGKYATAKELASAVRAAWEPKSTDGAMVVCTGGEPLLQMDESLVAEIRRLGFYVAVETNGSIELMFNVDWLCVSPKSGSPIRQDQGDELKLAFPQEGLLPDSVSGLRFSRFTLQPIDGVDMRSNTSMAVTYCKEHPQWRLGIQAHKVVGIP